MALRALDARHNGNISRLLIPRRRFRFYDVAMPALLEVCGLTVELPTAAGWVRPVSDVSFHLAPGETLGLVGESGCGKTMLSLALRGLLPPGARRTGEVWLAVRSSARSEVEGTKSDVARDTGADQRLNLVALTERELAPVRGREIAMVFQEPMTALNPCLLYTSPSPRD